MQTKKENVFTNMHPLHRIFLGMVFATLAYVAIPKDEFSRLLFSMILWTIFSATFNITSWIVLFKRPIDGIRKAAMTDDGSKLFVFVMVLLSSFTSLAAVLLLMISKNEETHNNSLFFPVIIFGMLCSWVMVHTIFSFHYAHIYYDDPEGESDVAGGLEFPKENKPDYIDFAYFSFVIGCTFQVSDVEISSRKIRRVVLLHSLIAFLLNTFVVALTINLVAGLNK
jgi:uncharacterized membrane protein